MQAGTSCCTVSDQDHQDSFSRTTHRLTSLLPKCDRNCKELPAAFGGQAVPVTVATPEALGPYSHSDISHLNPCRREVHRNNEQNTAVSPSHRECFYCTVHRNNTSKEHCLSPSQTWRPNKTLAKTHFAGLGEALIVSSLAC